MFSKVLNGLKQQLQNNKICSLKKKRIIKFVKNGNLFTAMKNELNKAKRGLDQHVYYFQINSFLRFTILFRLEICLHD